MDQIPLPRYALISYLICKEGVLIGRNDECSDQSHDEWFELFLVQSYVTRFEETVSSCFLTLMTMRIG